MFTSKINSYTESGNIVIMLKMCIQDNVDRNLRPFKFKKWCVCAVSYTQLDVYKRQP